jgi:hypothetical protein
VAPETSDKKTDSKKSTKKARPMTSGELRALAAAKTQKEEKKSGKAEKAAPERQITVEVWGRGNSSPLVLAFLSEHRAQRTVKRGASEWRKLFEEWKALPRG